MPAPVPAFASPPPPTPAETLLLEWEARTRPHALAYARLRPALLAHLSDFYAQLHPDNPINLDPEDVRYTLQAATGLGLATAAAGGVGRADQVVQELLAALATQRSDWPATDVAVSCLMSILSNPADDLQMDELSEITETLRQHIGPEAELIFGHCLHPAADATGLRIWLLVGYAAPPPHPAPTRPPQASADGA